MKTHIRILTLMLLTVTFLSELRSNESVLFIRQPSGEQTRRTLIHQPIVQLLAPVSPNAEVTMLLCSGVGTLLGTTTVKAVNGIAEFHDLIIETDSLGPYAITAEAEGCYTVSDIWHFNENCNFLSSIPLPVEISSFVAETKNGKNTLKWRTATEVNNFGFEVEKNSDGTKWNKIGFVKGSGTTNSPKDYAYIDVNDKERVFYRLKQVDNDGKFEYSNQVEVVSNVVLQYSLNQNYPNPFNGATIISFTIPFTSHVTLTLYDMTGKNVGTIVSEEMSADNHSCQVDASALSSGMYFYRLQAGSFTNTRRLTLIK